MLYWMVIYILIFLNNIEFQATNFMLHLLSFIGIDFDIEAGQDHYSNLVGKLYEYGLKGKEVYLRAVL